MSRLSRAMSGTVLVGAALLASMVLAYVFLHHDRIVTSGMRAVFFVAIPSLGILLPLAALRLNPETRLALALSLAAAATSVYGFELYLSYRAASLGDDLPADFDRRSRGEVVADLRARGVKAYPAIFPSYLLTTTVAGDLRSPISLAGKEVLPLGGVANTLSVLCNESGTYEVFDADEMGFNNPRGLWSGPLQIAAVGDSFTQGYCVPREHTFVGRIRARYPHTLSLGTSGAGPLVELAMVKEFLPDRRPARVLWFFTDGNDLPGDLAIEKRSPLLLRYLAPDFRQGLEGLRPEINAALAAYLDGLIAERENTSGPNAGRLQAAISFVGLSAVRASLRLPSTTPDEPDYALFERILREANRTVEQWGGCLLLINLSGHPAADRPPVPQIRASVRAIAEKLRIRYVDARRPLREDPEPSRFFPFGRPAHYNVEGHRVVADAVLSALEEASGQCSAIALP